MRFDPQTIPVCPTVMSHCFSGHFLVLYEIYCKISLFTSKIFCLYIPPLKRAGFTGNWIKLGPYGFIKGSQYFIAGTVGRVAFAEEDYRYLLEGIILQLLDMGLGDHCLGGTFKRSGWAQALKMPSGMVIPAITLV
jgi:hypothetical protein